MNNSKGLCSEIEDSNFNLLTNNKSIKNEVFVSQTKY